MVEMMKSRRKFQVSNGYLLECDQLARVLRYMLDHLSAPKISRQRLMEGTGLANRQIESLVSIGVAIGLVRSGRQTLTSIGALVANHDVFLDNKGTLEWIHYASAGSARNLIWFEIFNTLLPAERPMLVRGWIEHLRTALAGQYTDGTIGKHLNEEVRFVANAYLDANFAKLELLHQSSDGTLHQSRYVTFEPPVFAAMLYDYAFKNQINVLQLTDVAGSHGAPAYVFGTDVTSLRQLVEELHERNWIRYETTHGLDQIRLKPGLGPINFLKGYYTRQDPSTSSEDNHEEGLF
jgi:hypothetical protein